MVFKQYNLLFKLTSSYFTQHLLRYMWYIKNHFHIEFVLKYCILTLSKISNNNILSPFKQQVQFLTYTFTVFLVLSSKAYFYYYENIIITMVTLCFYFFSCFQSILKLNCRKYQQNPLTRYMFLFRPKNLLRILFRHIHAIQNMII